MLSVAVAGLRARWGSLAGPLAALALGVAVIATMALVLGAASADPHRLPRRFAAAPAVVQADPNLRLRDRYGTPTAEQPALPASVVARFPGAALDRSFPVRTPGGPADQVGHGWASAAFAPYALVSGRAPGRPGEIVATGGARVGQRVRVHAGETDGSYTVVGVARPAAHAADVERAVGVEHAIFFTDAEAARLSPSVDALVPADQAAARQAASIPGVRVLTGRDRALADPGALSDRANLTSLTSFLGVAALLSASVSLYVTASAFGLSVARRRRELALLRTLGATPAQVVRAVGTEAVLVGVAGSIAGCVLGLVGGPLLARWLAGHDMAPAWFTVPRDAGAIAPLALAFVSGVLVAVLAVVAASVRAATVRPAEALREVDVERGGSGLPRRLLGLAAFACGIGLLLLIAIVMPDLALDAKTDVELALLVVGGAALLAPTLLPSLVGLLTWPFTRGAGPGGLLARERVATGARQAAGTIVPLVITLGLAVAVLGATGIAESVKERGLHSEAAPADLVVLPSGGAGGSGGSGLSAALVARVRAVPGVTASAITDTSVLAHEPALTPFHLEAPTPVPFSAIAVDSPAVLGLRVRQGSLNGLNDTTVALDASWHKRAGQAMRLWLADGTPVSLQVTAVFDAAPGAPRIVLGPHRAGRSAQPGRLYLRATPAAEPKVRAALASRDAAFGEPDAKVVTTSRWTAAVSDRQAEQTRIGLLVMIGIAGVYGAIGTVATAATAISGRRRELALLRRIGTTRLQAIRFVCHEYALLAVAGVVTAGGAAGVVLLGLGGAS
ncbi:FtsX-like permease family protein [Actinomadura harenae]|uniref:FtsX-like permease family protein n=1 Tax=Actinomadura harenae TaxID=2483351 RepID=A0A3M2LWS6_9ACTN|nr:FtsX-like permease family protein [Actinomadura harenae]RMI41881.1 FtsX-like permease family protein [Actinomadura harenae]